MSKIFRFKSQPFLFRLQLGIFSFLGSGYLYGNAFSDCLLRTVSKRTPTSKTNITNPPIQAPYNSGVPFGFFLGLNFYFVSCLNGLSQIFKFLQINRIIRYGILFIDRKRVLEITDTFINGEFEPIAILAHYIQNLTLLQYPVVLTHTHYFPIYYMQEPNPSICLD